MSVSLVDLQPIYRDMEEKLSIYMREVMDSKQFILGPMVSAFEKEFADYLDCPHVIGVASGTDALLLALMALDIKPGDEVITTPFTFFATAGCIARLGAKPVFVDVKEDSFNINCEEVRKKLNRKCKAIIPVHLFGQAADMTELLDIAGKIPVVEDVAQAVGGNYGGNKLGSFGAFGCFSFYPAKNLGAAGDAGAIATKDEKFAARLRKLREHGAVKRYFHDEVGLNSRLDSLQAAVLRAGLPHLDKWNHQRRILAKHYGNSLSDCKEFALPEEGKNREHVYNQYTLQCKHREALSAHLKEKGIGHAVYYPLPLHLQECFGNLGYKKGDLPVAERLADLVLSIPVFPGLEEKQQTEVIDALKHFKC